MIIAGLEPIKFCDALETVLCLIQRIKEIIINAVNSGLIDANHRLDVRMTFKISKSKRFLRCSQKNVIKADTL